MKRNQFIQILLTLLLLSGCGDEEPTDGSGGPVVESPTQTRPDIVSPTIEAEHFSNTSLFEPFEIQSSNAITYIVAVGERNDDASDNAAGQAHYEITASSSRIELYATVNLRDDERDSFFTKIEGLSDEWLMENSRLTNGFEELLIGTWSNAQPGETYTVKILRRETGALIDSLRAEGAMFGVVAPIINPFTEGKALYEKQCADCHGIDGDGGTEDGLMDCNFCGSIAQLADKIESGMPLINPALCDETCSAYVARYVMDQFNPVDLSTTIAPSKVRAWLLTFKEYRVTLASLFGLEDDYGWFEGFADVDNDQYFHTNSDFLLVSQPIALYFLEQSEAVVNGLSEQQLNDIIVCNPEQSNCLAEFTRSFSRRAFRRDVSNDSAERYQVFSDGASGIERYRRIMIGILDSPYFLYRTEMGAVSDLDDEEVKLTPFEVANLVSYALLGEPPSDDLLQKANAGELSTSSSLRSVVNEMMSLPKVAERLQIFIRAWLLVDEGKWREIEHSEAACNNFEVSKAAIENEFTQFLKANANIDGSLSGLFKASFPEPTGALRAYYLGNNDPAGLGPLRQGILDSAIFAARHSQYSIPSPVMRGKVIRERLLCQEIPEPPANIPALGEDTNGQVVVTNRDAFEVHLSDATCASCHAFMDPLGFTMESLDACGRFQSMDNGEFVNTSGEITGTTFNQIVDNLLELSNALANEKTVRECFTSQAFQFYKGMAKEDEPSVLNAHIAKGLDDNDSFRDVLIQLLSHDNILLRRRD